MAKVVTAPETIESNASDFTVFLAGAIDMGTAPNWQQQVIDQLRDQPDDLILFNPRRTEFTPNTLDDQIRWELNALEQADVIFMWLPRDTKAPISLFEAGLYWQSDKLFIGAESGFYRRRNLELTAEKYDVRLFDNLQAQLTEVMHQVSENRRIWQRFYAKK